MRKEKGSALVIAMLLIAAVGAIAFGIGKLLFLEVGTEQVYENGSVAYYSATSGIEEGLLRYRYDTKAQVPTAASWALRDNKVFRTNVTDNVPVSTGTSSAGIDPTLPANLLLTSANKQFYDLRMGYLGTNGNPWYGNLVNNQAMNHLSFYDFARDNYSTGDYSVLKIAQDDSVKIDLTGLNLDTGADADKLILMVRFEFPAATDFTLSQNYCKILMEVTFTYDDGTGPKQYKSLLSARPSICGPIIGISANKMLGATDIIGDASAPGSGYYFFDEANLVGDVFNEAGVTPPVDSAGTSLSLTLKPLDTSASVGLAKAKCVEDTTLASCSTLADVVAGPFTTITSTGYYGGVTRKLVANVDRQSGTLYDLFDYVINKNN